MKNIFIVEDEIVVAKDIECILTAKGYNVVDIATSYEMAKKKLLLVRPDLILCDINLSGSKTGIDLMQELHTKYCIPFIFITAYSDMETIEKASKLKPLNYITKPFNEKQLISSVKLALVTSNEPDKPTQKEQIVLNLLAKGKSSKQIAEALSISFNTVETHRKNMMSKYAVNTTAELICMATAKGWVVYQPN